MNYMGSKSRIAKDIVPIIQSYIDNNNIKTYIEPFVGGMNVIDKIHCENKVGSDISPYLIALHKYAQNNGVFPVDITREEYNKVRESYNNHTDEYTDTDKGVYGYLASCNGRFFDGGYAKPCKHRNKNYYQEHRNNIIKQRENIEYKNVRLLCCDYTFYIGVRDAVIYCDPPYQNTKSYGTNKNFDHDKFWNWCRQMGKDNIVIVSEQQAPNDFKQIWEKPVKRTIDTASNITNKTSTEKLFILK